MSDEDQAAISNQFRTMFTNDIANESCTAIAHAKDEKHLTEAVDRSEEFYDALEDNSPAQMYVAREIVYSLVDDEYSAQKLAS